MKQNKYDEADFFQAYSQMARSKQGLEAAGEWHVFKSLLPDLKNKDVLDLGCGYGWHCRFVREQGAHSVIGIDISEKMLHMAREKTTDPAISYLRKPIEEIDFSDGQFDLVISSLAFHYIASFSAICTKVHRFLKPGGMFIFSVEHPIFTCRAEQNWHVDHKGNRLHWPVDDYQAEGIRETTFLGKHVIKYHRTISTYITALLEAGFAISAVEEPTPANHMLENDKEMLDETRRPMFLIVAGVKNGMNGIKLFNGIF